MWGRKSFFRAWKTGRPNHPTTTTQQVHWAINPFIMTPVTHDTCIHDIYMVWYRLQTDNRSIMILGLKLELGWVRVMVRVMVGVRAEVGNLLDSEGQIAVFV